MSDYEEELENLQKAETSNEPAEIADALYDLVLSAYFKEDWTTLKKHAPRLGEISLAIKDEEERLDSLAFALEVLSKATEQTAQDPEGWEGALEIARSCYRQHRQLGCPKEGENEFLLTEVSLLRKLGREKEAGPILEKLYRTHPGAGSSDWGQLLEYARVLEHLAAVKKALGEPDPERLDSQAQKVKARGEALRDEALSERLSQLSSKAGIGPSKTPTLDAINPTKLVVGLALLISLLLMAGVVLGVI